MRYSRQRELIRRTVGSLCDHPTAEEIYAEAVRECPNLSLGTVYRNLNHLVETGRVRRVSIPGQADRFDNTLCRHGHMCCTACGSVTDVMLDDEAVMRLVQGQPGEVTNYSLTLFGLCTACCQKKQADRSGTDG